jgi:TatD DNase family protein
MILADTHTHLYLEEFHNDRQQTVERAISNGVKYLLLPNVDSKTLPALHSLCDAFPASCFPMIGLHPTSVKDNFEEELLVMEKNLALRSYIAIGEIGMDLYWDTAYVIQQRQALIKQLVWANKYQLPAVIHTRNANDEVLTILEELHLASLKGVFHCFSGNIKQAEKAISLGFMLGIGGVITFKNSGLGKVVAHIGLQYLLLETDSPYLAPVPYRGKRNESAYLPLIAAKIAEIKAINMKEVAEVTTNNAKQLFHLP